MQPTDVDQMPNIVKMAGKIFAERGIEDSKMIDIANALKISKKTIYKYFESKDELVLAVYSYRLIELNRAADAITNSSEPFAKKLVQILELIHQSLSIVTPQAVEDLKKSYPELKLRIEDYLSNAVFVRFKNFLTNGLTSGDVKNSVVIESTVLLYRDALKNFIYMRNYVDLPPDFGIQDPMRVLCHSLNTIFRGILHVNAEQEFEDYLKQSPSLHFLLKEKSFR